MKEKLLELICCPHCKSDFSVIVDKTADGEIRSGTLTCDSCGKIYKITDFIPRILDSHEDPAVSKTSENFGNQWTMFKEMYSFYKEEFLNWVYPLKEDDFKGKKVLDAGCGMARFLYYAAEFGAEEAVGVDISSSVDTAYRTVKNKPNAHVIQADLANLPFDREFDLFYSIGVLHHTTDPEGCFHSVCKALKPGGTAHAWVYGYENNEWIVNWVNPLRKNFTSKLPTGILSAISFAITLFLQPILKIFYYPTGVKNIAFLKKRLPYFPYMYWLSRRNFAHTHVVVHDHLTAPVAFYIKKEDFRSWFDKEKMEDLELVHRNKNSWTGVARSNPYGSPVSGRDDT